MTIPSILNVAISLIFIYVTLSVFVSGIQERITSLFQWRASHLKSCIINLLDHHVTEQFYHHPLIESLNQSDTQWWQKFLPWKTDPIGPSYIDSQTFSTVLLDILNENYDINLDEYTDNIDKLVEKLNALKQEQKKRNQTVYQMVFLTNSLIH